MSDWHWTLSNWDELTSILFGHNLIYCPNIQWFTASCRPVFCYDKASDCILTGLREVVYWSKSDTSKVLVFIYNMQMRTFVSWMDRWIMELFLPSPARKPLLNWNIKLNHNQSSIVSIFFAPRGYVASNKIPHSPHTYPIVILSSLQIFSQLTVCSWDPGPPVQAVPSMGVLLVPQLSGSSLDSLTYPSSPHLQIE